MSIALDVVVYVLVPILLILIALQINNRILFFSKGAQPNLNVSFTINDCTTTDANKSCSVQAQKNNVVPITLQLSATDNNKISGAELYFMFDMDGQDILNFEGYSDVNGTFTKEVIKEVRDFNGKKLLHLLFIADKKKDQLSSQAVLTLRFKGNKNGTDRLIFLTEPSSIVGPVSGTTYAITPQNTPEGTLNIAITVTEEGTSPTAIPTTVPGTDPTATVNPTVQATTTPQPSATPTTAPGTPNATATPTNTPTPINTPTATPTTQPTAPLPTARPTIRPTNTPTPSPTATPAPGMVSLNLAVRLQGITHKPQATYCENKKIKVTVGGGTLAQPKIFNDVVVTSNTQGIFTAKLDLIGVPAGNNYHIKIKGPQHLQRKFCTLTPVDTAQAIYRCAPNTGIVLQVGENNANLGSSLLFGGDFSLQDGVLSAQDTQYLKSRVLAQQENQTADLNCDNVVNGNDYSLLIESMKIKYDDE